MNIFECGGVLLEGMETGAWWVVGGANSERRREIRWSFREIRAGMREVESLGKPCLPGPGDCQVPDRRPEGIGYVLGEGEVFAVENGPERKIRCMYLQFIPSWVCLT